ncbi:MAG: fibronectin type III domain-containing protein [Smithella sp.]|nr:fibronectin type III domain-containing protein [Smithella sp.]
MNLTSNITIEAWVKKSEVDRTETILSKGPYSLKIAADNKPYLELENGSRTIASAGSPVGRVYAMTVYNGQLYAGTYDNGHVRRYDGGTTWTDLGHVASSALVYSLAVYNGNLYAGVNTLHVYRYDGGTTWTDVGNFGTMAPQVLTVYNNQLYVGVSGSGGNDRVYRYDGGTTWTDVGAVFSGGSIVASLTVYNGTLYAGINNGHVYRYDGGTTWTDTGRIGTNSSVGSLVVYNGKLYGSNSDYNASPDGHVYRYDGGTTWTDVGVVAAASPIYSLAVYNGQIYAGDWTGHVYYYDGGTTWTSIGQTSGSYTYSLVVCDGKLYAGTIDWGVVSIGSGVAAYSSTALTANTWNHVVGTYDGTTAKIYVNGVLAGSTAGAITVGTTTNNLLIGQSLGSSSGGFQSPTGEDNFYGAIDDVRLYNRALSLGEVTTQYERRLYTASEPTATLDLETVGGSSDGGALVYDGINIYAFKGGGVVSFYKYPMVFVGTITNLKKDAGGDAGWNTISWNSTVPANTLVKFRTRTAATEGGLSAATWSDWYTSSPADITSGINRWCEVEAYLQSTVSGTSPTISDFTVNYSINAPPELQNLTASQGSDGLVNISYQVRDIDTNDGSVNKGQATISFQYWDGSQWQEATTTVGEGLKDVADSPATDWTTYTGTWDPKTDYNSHYTTGMKIRVIANDNELVYNTATLDSSTFELDTVNPTSPSIEVNASTQYDSHEAALTLSVTDSTMQSGVKGSMMISLDSGFSGASWQTYNTASTITLATDPDIVYVKFKDAKGNVSATASVTTPQTPECIMSQDTSNVRIMPNEYRLFVAWEMVEDPPQGIFDHYSILRSTTNDDDDFTEINTVNDKEVNYYTDTTPEYNVLYYYKVFAYDSLGNISYRSNAVTGKADGIQDSGEGGGGTDITAPIVSNVTSTDVYTSQATITWTTDEFADSTVGYGNATSTLIYFNSPTMTKNHSVTLTNLSTNTPYIYSVKSKDPSNNETTDDNLGNYYNFTTLPGPIVSNVSVSQVTNNTARITWLTDTSSNSYVVYSTHSNLSGSTTHGSITEVSSPNSQNYYEHSVDLSNLDSGTRYYYYVESYDGSDVGVDNNQGSYYFFNTTYDFTPPEITLVSAANTAYTSTVTWVTDELATSQVEYGTTTAYGTLSPSSVTTTDLTIDHVIRLADLTEGTTYHYRVRSQDANGNESISNDYSFIPAREGDYTKPIISSVQIPDGSLFTTQATITWTTNELSDSTVEYSATQGVYSLSKNSASMVISHSIVLSDLSPNTTYFFRVKSKDFSDNTQTDNNGGVGYSLITKSGSIISNVYVSQVVNEIATIKWSTNSDSDSTVVYSTSANLSSPQTENEAALTKNHSVELTSLYPNVIYYFYVKSKDSQDNISRSDNQGAYYYFTTADDQTSPEINSVSSAATAYTATITWETDELATSQMEYGFTTGYGTETDLDSQLTIQHVVHLTNLTNDQTYHFRVKSEDANNNESTSGDYNFITTQEAEPTDTTAPVISEVNSYATETIGTITWKTDDSATSQIEYGPTTAYGTSSTLNSTLTVEHVVRLTDLTSEQIYHYRIKSKNDADLETISQDYTLTPQYVSQEIRVVAGGGGTVARDETPPVVSNIKVSDIKETSAVVTWTTDERATSLIDYGLTSAYTNTAHDSLTLATNHQITLSNLTKGTVYHYQVLSQDSSSNLRKSSDVTFTTLGGIVPATPTPENQNPSTPASSEGEGGSTTITPVNNVDKNFIAAMEEAKSLSSQVTAPVLENAFQDILDTLKDITPGPVIEKNPVVEVSATEAIIRWETNKRSNSMIAFVKASDFDKNKSEPYSQVVGQSNEHQLTHGVRIINLTPSTEYYFQTRSKGLIGSETKSKQYNFRTVSQVPEVITFSIKDVSARAATFDWQTNIPTNSQVKYIPYRNNKISSGEAQTINKSEFNVTHEITIKNFAPGTTYNISLEGKDSEGNNYSFLIPNFTTVKDSTSPIISQIRTSVALSSRGDEVQTIITWNTDEPANSQFEYQVGFAEDAPVVQMSKDITLKQDHLIVVTSFKPGSIYRFRVISEDSSGNKTQSITNTLLTPQKRMTVTELIFKNFQQTFGWMKNMGAKF